MTSVVDHKTQGGPGSIHSIQESNPPRRLTRLEKARLEALEAFGNCGFDSMVFKKKDFRTKLKASTSASKPLKRKNQEEDTCVASHDKVPTRKLACLQEPADGGKNVEKVGLKNGQKRAKKIGISATNNSRRQSRRVSSHVGLTSSVASGKRLTRVEKARLEAMQSFGEQGLDAVWKSCTQIMSKTLDKKDRKNDKEKSVEEQVSNMPVGVGTSEVLLCESENSTTSLSSTTVPETVPHHTAVSTGTNMQSNNKHQDTCETCAPPKQMIQVPIAHQEALPAGQTFDDIKTSSRITLTPQRNEATDTEHYVEQDSLSSSDGSLYDKQYPEQRIDLFSTLQGDASFANREALLETCAPPKQMIQVPIAHQEALPAGQTFDDIKTSSRITLTPQRNEATDTENYVEQDSLSSSDGSPYDKQYPKQRIDLFSTLQGDASFANREALLETSKRVVRTARNLETPSPQESAGVIYGHSK